MIVPISNLQIYNKIILSLPEIFRLPKLSLENDRTIIALWGFEHNQIKLEINVDNSIIIYEVTNTTTRTDFSIFNDEVIEYIQVIFENLNGELM